MKNLMIPSFVYSLILVCSLSNLHASQEDSDLYASQEAPWFKKGEALLGQEKYQQNIRFLKKKIAKVERRAATPSIKDSKTLAMMYIMLGSTYLLKEENTTTNLMARKKHGQAIVAALHKAIRYMKRADIPIDSEIYYGLARGYQFRQKTGDLKFVLEYFMKALPDYIDLNSKDLTRLKGSYEEVFNIMLGIYSALLKHPVMEQDTTPAIQMIETTWLGESKEEKAADKVWELSLGNAYLIRHQKGDHQIAFKYLQKSLKKNQESQESIELTHVYRSLGILMLNNPKADQKKIKKGIDYLEKYISGPITEVDPSIYALLGEAYTKQGKASSDINLAIRSFEEAIKSRKKAKIEVPASMKEMLVKLYAKRTKKLGI